MRRTACLALVLFAASLGSGCSGAPPKGLGVETPAERTTFSFDAEKKPSFDLFTDYRMKPGDVLDVLFQVRSWVERETFTINVGHTLEVRFLNAPDLNDRPSMQYNGQRVLPDGTISLPHLGTVKVSGKTVKQLTEELQQRYSTILRDPTLIVIVPEHEESIKQLRTDLHTSPRGLSRLVTIRPDGFVTFPMLGDVFVADRTIPEVGEELNTRYAQIMPELHCDLFLEHHSGSVVYVAGQVKNPGAFPVVKPITVIEALTLAGGYDQIAKLDEVVVVRRTRERLVATRINLEGNLSGASQDPFFFVYPDDIVVVPRTRLSKAAEVARYIGDILFFRGWSLSFGWDLRNAPEGDASLGIDLD